MDDVRLAGTSVLAAVGLAAAASYATASAAVLGVTPLGVAIYAGVGVAVPQYLFARRTDSALRLGIAALAAAVAAFALVAGVVAGGLHTSGPPLFVGALSVLLVGTILGAAVREVRAGYRARSH